MVSPADAALSFIVKGPAGADLIPETTSESMRDCGGDLWRMPEIKDSTAEAGPWASMVTPPRSLRTQPEIRFSRASL